MLLRGQWGIAMRSHATSTSRLLVRNSSACAKMRSDAQAPQRMWNAVYEPETDFLPPRHPDGDGAKLTQQDTEPCCNRAAMLRHAFADSRALCKQRSYQRHKQQGCEGI